jgi:hypothetical protein
MEQLDPTEFPIDWKSFDHLFAPGAGFRQMQRLVFPVSFPGAEEEEVSKEMRKRLPECNTRGILYIYLLM